MRKLNFGFRAALAFSILGFISLPLKAGVLAEGCALAS
jgi:hypothetical protein